MQRLSVLTFLALAAGASAQDGEISFQSSELAPGIFMIQGVGGFAGGNIGLLVGDNYVAMIDDSLEPLSPQLEAHVFDIAGRPASFVINTHVHGDHVGGNAHFVQGGAIVFAHDNIRKRLLEDPSPAGGETGLPVVTFAEGVKFHLDEIEAHVFHLPSAHTDGDAAIHFPQANVIHTGDAMFHKLFPFIDLDNGGSVEGYIDAQTRLLELADDDTKIIPGHGPVANRAGLEEDLAVLVDSRDRVGKLVDAGMSEDEIVAKNPLSDYHDTYNWGFITTERMTRTLYRDLTAGD